MNVMVSATTEAAEAGSDMFGDRWQADLTITRKDRSAMIRTIWIKDGAQLRLVTCWVR
jgi:hypothetical protein